VDIPKEEEDANTVMLSRGGFDISPDGISLSIPRQGAHREMFDSL